MKKKLKIDKKQLRNNIKYSLTGLIIGSVITATTSFAATAFVSKDIAYDN